MAKVTKDTMLGEIVRDFENAPEVLQGFGMHCFSCALSQLETLEEAGEVHGIDVDFMVEKLNEILVEKDKGQEESVEVKTNKTSGRARVAKMSAGTKGASKTRSNK